MKTFLPVLSTLLTVACCGAQAAAPAAAPAAALDLARVAAPSRVAASGPAGAPAAARAGPPVPASASASAPTSASASAPVSASAAAVNPLTGQPLAFETAQRRLEQMRLETQLLEEEAKQAAIRNNMALAPIRRTSEERRLQAEMFGPTGAGGPAVPSTRAAVPAPVAGASARPARGQGTSAQGPMPSTSAVPSLPAVVLPPQGPQVLAILRNGERRRAIVQAGATTATVSEGDEWMGRRIGPITDGAVTIDGTVIELPRNPAVIAAIDRRPPPGQPQPAQGSQSPSASPRVPAVPGQAQAFPPLPPLPALPAIGPIDPRNPLSAFGPQPTPAAPMPPRPAVQPLTPAVTPGFPPAFAPAFSAAPAAPAADALP